MQENKKPQFIFRLIRSDLDLQKSYYTVFHEKDPFMSNLHEIFTSCS